MTYDSDTTTGYDRSVSPPTPDQVAAQLAQLNAALEAFVTEMKARLAHKAGEGRTGWDNPALAKKYYIDFLGHVAGIDLAAGQEVDGANFLLFLWWQRIERERAARLSASPAP